MPVRSTSDYGREAMSSTADIGSRAAQAALGDSKVPEPDGHAMTVSGENTCQIPRLSEAIAFQANIVALSVAVEATQTGRAGPAMASSEARGPSLRCAQASKNTGSSHESITNSSGAGEDQVS